MIQIRKNICCIDSDLVDPLVKKHISKPQPLQQSKCVKHHQVVDGESIATWDILGHDRPGKIGQPTSSDVFGNIGVVFLFLSFLQLQSLSRGDCWSNNTCHATCQTRKICHTQTAGVPRSQQATCGPKRGIPCTIIYWCRQAPKYEIITYSLV